MSSKAPATLPTPEYVGPGHYLCPSFNEYRRAKGVRYDVYLEEHGWRCYNPWCKNPWACDHAKRVPDYIFEQDIISILPEQKPLSPAKREMAAGRDLAYHFDYSSFSIPPTHVPTRRSKVASAR